MSSVFIKVVSRIGPVDKSPKHPHSYGIIEIKERWSVMGRQSGQMSMVILDTAELIPSDHLLRKINQMVSFDFIYDLAAPYYPANGRPSVDSVSMFKMLLVGCLYYMEQKLIDGKEMAADGSYIPAEVSRNSWIDIEVEVEQSMLSYLDDLDQELTDLKSRRATQSPKRLQQAQQTLSVAISTMGVNEV